MNTNRMTFRVTFSAAVVLLIVASVLLTDVTDEFRSARLDLTDHKIFTMSEGAESILSGLDVPVQIKLYITGAGQMPSRYKTLESDIREKLDEYSHASGGLLQYSIHDPQSDPEMQASLNGRGIQSFVEQSIEKDEMSAKLIWSAMTIAYLNRPLEVMPQLRVEQMPIFEYDVMLRIQRLLRERDPIVLPLRTKRS